MINKKLLLVTFVAMLTTGCASHNIQMNDQVMTFDQPHRIIRHNFKHKYDIVPTATPIRKEKLASQICKQQDILKPSAEVHKKSKSSDRAQRRLIKLNFSPVSSDRRNSIILGKM